MTDVKVGESSSMRKVRRCEGRGGEEGEGEESRNEGSVHFFRGRKVEWVRESGSVKES